jgi:hypothetical protein
VETRHGKAVLAASWRRQVALSLWPTARPFLGFSWIKDVGSCADWRDRTYLLTGRVAKMMRKTSGHWIGRLP